MILQVIIDIYEKDYHCIVVKQSKHVFAYL